ncbi:MAG TPA: DMT family transporter [Saprospiraceae bacterium]|nr:DMT family transporter [Saprospiraceae bacterium]HPN68657.1 DMT family transporter [Saprospiraceae bacterium]
MIPRSPDIIYMNKLLWIFLAFVSGAFLPIQAGLNSRLGKNIESPVFASFFSFLVGSIGLVTYILLTKQTISIPGLKETPWQVWLGGLLGAFYVTVIILAFPKLGPGLTFGLVVAGQMIFSILLEHYNIMVAQQNPINLMKVLGVVLVVAGVVIIRNY